MPIRPVAGNPPISCNHACHRARGSNGGTDYAVAVGTPVRAPFAGKLEYIPGHAVNGNFIRITRSNGDIAYLLHLSSGSKNRTVKEGEVVGKSGATGRVTGPHLHAHVLVKGVTTGMEEYLGVKPDPWADIAAVQKRLNVWRKHWGLKGITVDGVKGPQTTSAVKDAQKRFKITVDGIVGPATWAKLSATPPKPAPEPDPSPVEPMPEPTPDPEPDPEPGEPDPVEPAPEPGRPDPVDEVPAPGVPRSAVAVLAAIVLVILGGVGMHELGWFDWLLSLVGLR